jgi:hypothetical protein
MGAVPVETIEFGAQARTRQGRKCYGSDRCGDHGANDQALARAQGLSPGLTCVQMPIDEAAQGFARRATFGPAAGHESKLRRIGQPNFKRFALLQATVLNGHGASQNMRAQRN